MRKLIYSELYKKLKFNGTNESIRENGTRKILCDFEIEIDHLIQARRPDIVKLSRKKKKKRKKKNWKKENLPFNGHCSLCGQQSENQKKKKKKSVKYLNFAREPRKL